MVRIIAGSHKGRKLATPKGRGLRPTADRAKEALFNILGPRVPGSRFLDLFAGTGSVGLEAASRGAERVVLVESRRTALEVLKRNVTLCGFGEGVVVVAADTAAYVRGPLHRDFRFDIIFLDPPYGEEGAYGLVRDIAEQGMAAAGGIVIAEHDRRRPLADSYGTLALQSERRVGDTVFTFYGEGDAS